MDSIDAVSLYANQINLLVQQINSFREFHRVMSSYIPNPVYPQNLKRLAKVEKALRDAVTEYENYVD